VCFPNSTLPISVSLPMNVVRESIIDCTLLLNPQKCLRAIEKLLKEWNQNLDKSIADLIQYHVLAPTFRLIPNPKLSIQETDEKFLQLTQEQYQLLDWLDEQKQVLIKGSAGTGKTLLLIEKARRLADQGFSVLVLCFNIRLSEYLKSVIKNSNLVYVDNFHGFL
jgi:primosomal protein N'